MINGYVQDSTVLGLSGLRRRPTDRETGRRGQRALGDRGARPAPRPACRQTCRLTYQLSQNWQLLATYYESRRRLMDAATVVSPLTPPVATSIPALAERGIFLTIRYQRAAGSHFAPLGGAPGSGSGEIAGIVYLDANNNGHIDAGESGAPNVTVVLDGRFSVQTDANGRFSFPVVASGPSRHHRDRGQPAAAVDARERRPHGSRGHDPGPNRYQHRRAASSLEASTPGELLRLKDDVTAHDCLQDLNLGDLLGGNLEDIAVEHDQIR